MAQRRALQLLNPTDRQRDADIMGGSHSASRSALNGQSVTIQKDDNHFLIFYVDGLSETDVGAVLNR